MFCFLSRTQGGWLVHGFTLWSPQVTGVPEDQILVAVFPGLPTSAELFILPPKNLTERRKGNEEDLEQVSERALGRGTCPHLPSKGTQPHLQPQYGGSVLPLAWQPVRLSSTRGCEEQQACPEDDHTAWSIWHMRREGGPAALVPAVGIPGTSSALLLSDLPPGGWGRHRRRREGFECPCLFLGKQASCP